MLRFVSVILIWLVLLGGMQIFMQTRSTGQTVVASEQAKASGDYRLEITTTFAVEPDPFALVIEVNEAAPALLVQLQGRDLVRVTDRLEAGTPITVEPLHGMKVGRNEFFVRAHPPAPQALKANALRLRLLRDGQVLSDQTLWSTPPEPLVVTFTVDTQAQPEESHDDQPH